MSVTSKIPNVVFLGLLVSLCLLSGFGTAETIVDTDPHVVLEVGTRGILPCRIQTKAYSVEWKRQLSSETELLVSLDTYAYVGARDGPGYEAGMFNITDDYSLVIKDVKVPDEGLYICSVSDFKSGKPFENSTRVSVQAFPDEPFPTIPNCIGNFVKPGVCTLIIHATSNLSCLVEGYYPDIDLFFLHGSEKVTSTQYIEWNNTDWTKNKNITIPISVSDEPYECVASRLPGMFGNPSVLVIVKAISYGPRAAVIVAPVLVVGICLSIAVICYLGNRRGRRRGFMPILMRTPIDGPVSKLELWKLVKKAKESDVVEKLRAVLRRLRRLSETDASKLEKDDDFYESLCEWKKETSPNSNQRKDLYSACNKEGMSEIIRTMKDYVRNASYEVSRANIDDILWSIGDPRKIINLLKALGLDHEHDEADVTASETGRRGVIDFARNELLKWRVRVFDMNPVVILSLKLDELECETDFIKYGELRLDLVPSRSPIDGPVSKLEVWKLVTKAKESHVVEKLRAALCCLAQMSETDASELKDNEEFYECLCKWKRETSSNSKQRNYLYSACIKVGMSDIIRALEDYVRSNSYDVHDVSRANIDYVLWGIGDPMKIIELLKALGLDHEAVATASEKGRREVINMARNELKKWRKLKFDINPLVILSLKLDDLECETDFFKLSLRQKEEIDVEEMKDICCQVFKLHFTSLLKAIRDNHGELAYQIKRFVEENNASLFDTVEMLKDWEQNVECSYFEKRRKLQEAVEAASQRDHKVNKWPPDDELRVIASFLSPESVEQLCSKLHIKSPPEEASHDHDDQEKLFQVLTEWRDNHASSKDLMEKHSELFTALKEDERGGLVPRVKGPLVYKAELVDLAFHLFAQDLLPFTEALGIPSAKLVAYRPTFHPLHMTQGTIRLVCKLSESGERSHLLKLLKEMPYPNVFASAMLALEISFKEVCTISGNPANSQEREKMQASSTQNGDNSVIATIKKKGISPGANSAHGDATYHEGIQLQSQNETLETMALLTSASKVKDHNQVSAESLAFLKHFKDWRELPRLLPFNFRLALATRSRSKDNYFQMSHFLRELKSTSMSTTVNRTRYSMEEIMSRTFIHYIVQNMDPKQRETLGKIIEGRVLHYMRNNRSPLQNDWTELTPVARDYIYCWTSEWIMEMIRAKGVEGKEGEIAKKHIECNDKLVDNGFLDLAREIMIIEQLPIH